MRDRLTVWKKAGFDFTLDWLLRNATTVATGRALFTALSNVKAGEFERSLMSLVAHVGTFLDTVSGLLGLDHDRVLMGRYAIPVVSRLLELNDGKFISAAQVARGGPGKDYVAKRRLRENSTGDGAAAPAPYLRPRVPGLAC
ncbi:hypothetical protein [Rhodococcus pyridinivorans]